MTLKVMRVPKDMRSVQSYWTPSPRLNMKPRSSSLRNRRFRDDDDLGFMFNMGLGVQYDWTDRMSFGTRMTFNVLPGEVLGDRFFFSWQMAQLRYRF